MDGSSVTAFKAASTFFVQAVDRVAEAQWNQPALGVWSVLELVGHTNRAQTTIEEYLLHPVAPEPKESAYFDEASIARRGRESVAALGSDPKKAVALAAVRAAGLV